MSGSWTVGSTVSLKVSRDAAGGRRVCLRWGAELAEGALPDGLPPSLAGALPSLDRRGRGEASPRELLAASRQMGRLLAGLLFPGDVRGSWDAARAAAGDEPVTLLVRSEDQEVRGLPLEALVCPLRGTFLAHDGSWHASRRPPTCATPPGAGSRRTSPR